MTGVGARVRPGFLVGLDLGPNFDFCFGLCLKIWLRAAIDGRFQRPCACDLVMFLLWSNFWLTTSVLLATDSVFNPAGDVGQRLYDTSTVAAQLAAMLLGWTTR